ncbi:hypothetical protein V6N13_122083 [Hibiscus sabdariffa]
MVSVDMAVVDVWQPEDLGVRLDVSNKLEKNYVKTVSFNVDDECNLITCGAYGQVRNARISECAVETRLLAKHQRDASDPAFEPGRPHLTCTCGEDRLVQHIDLRTEATTELLRCQPIGGCSVRNPIIPLYSIAIDPRNPNVFSIVGSDQYARLYDIRKYKCGGSIDFGQPIDYFYPPHVMVNTNGYETGYNPVPFSPSSSCSEAIGKGTPQVYEGHGKKETVDSVSFFGHKSDFVPHPHTIVLASSGADGIKIWTPNAIDKGKLPTTKIEQDQQEA